MATAPAGAPSNDDQFAAAFAAAASGGDLPADTPAAPAPAADPAPDGGDPASAAPPAPATDDTPPADADAAPGGEPAPGADPAPAEPPAAPAAASDPAPASADDIVKGLADLLKQQPPAPAPEVPAAAPPAQEDPPIYSEADLATLTEYEKNWPDVSAAEALKRRAEYHDIFKFIFTEVEKYTRPLFEQMRTVGNTIHLGELRAAVPDYSEELENSVAAWVETQPAYLQGAMKQVMQQGTSDEVADLIGRYRAATGAAAPAPASPPAPAPAPAKPAQTELSSAAKQAAESLAPVSSDRSQIPAGEDPGDFASAFARYAAETMPK